MRRTALAWVATFLLGASACGNSPLTSFADPGDTPRLDYDQDATGDAGSSEPACASGTHEENGECLADVRACETGEGTGHETYADGIWGPCEVSDCHDNMHAEDDTCVPSVRECGMDNGSGHQTWQDGVWGPCSVASCAAGYHSEDGTACVYNSRDCDAFANGTGESTWEAGAWGDCVLAGCHAGFHEEAGACHTDTRACPDGMMSDGTGTQTWVGDGYGPCQVDACHEGYHIENNSCVSDRRTCIDFANGSGESQWTGSEWGACQLQACDAGFHEESGICQSNERNCSDEVSNGAGSQTWQGDAYGSCTVTACDTGFHQEANACLLNLRACEEANGSGMQSWSNGTWGDCYANRCDDTYHLELGNCLSDTRDCAVANGTGSESWNLGVWGRCQVATCDSSYVNHMNACILEADRPALDPAGIGYIELDATSTPVQLGSPSDEGGRLPHEGNYAVTLTRGFWLAQTEITQGAWKAMARDENPASFNGCGDDCPVEQVDWFAALAYANAVSQAAGLETCYVLSPAGCADEVDDWSDGKTACTQADFAGLDCEGYRLPTEAEWEYAYRAGTQGAYYNGDNTALDSCDYDENLDAIGWYCGNSAFVTQEMGQKSPNGWQLYDMAGNVSEWVWDGYESREGVSETLVDPTGKDNASQRSVRGGSWGDGASLTRAAARAALDASTRASTLGFRLARTRTP